MQTGTSTELRVASNDNNNVANVAFFSVSCYQFRFMQHGTSEGVIQFLPRAVQQSADYVYLF